MDRSDLIHRQSSLVNSGCCSMMSPSCFPVPNDHVEYSRIHCRSHRSRGWRWRYLLRRLLRDSTKKFYRSKPLSFQYDAVSYSQNFDDGCHRNEQPGRHSMVFQDVRWEINK
ncbi:hypothetical protein I3843_08G138800 [Carya illinoinensis]|nr:hypothetical protein I3843_08G138800 [Carya illinoinensis]